ncbi:MAG: hypothetical protein D6729_10175 [Deltaproteobacteria bacterium]|nr:MAG: hypothetical protein D6729_10175 [Deltaproteobacteria bacterium]
MPGPKRYPAYRLALYLLVGGLLAVGIAAYFVGVVRALEDSSSNGAPPGAGALPPAVSSASALPLDDTEYATCRDRLVSLYDGLNQRVWTLGTLAAVEGRGAAERWRRFRHQWRAELDAAVAQCRLAAPPAGDSRAAALARLAADLRTLERLYGSWAETFFEAHGERLEAIRRSVDRLP